MTLFYSGNPVSIGGRKRRQVFRVLSDEWDELVEFSSRNPDICEIIGPDRKHDSWKSRKVPVLYVDVDWEDAVRLQKGEKVPEMYLRVLTWVLRRQIYSLRFGLDDPAIVKFFEAGVRGTLRDLLRSGSWVDNPETPGLKNLNSDLEKIDLVRRSNLNFTSQQDEGRLFYKEKEEYEKQVEKFGDPDSEYKSGSAQERARLREERPWMAAKWIEVFGE